jgi:methylated-DNA-[protein]-cysteine S-methyltransferase
MDHHTTYMDTAIGTLAITGSAAGIRAITFLNTPPANPDAGGDVPDCVTECVTQLDAYFKGTRTDFTVTLDMQGTDFQQRVWRELLTIPFGRTTTYGAIAQKLGDPKAVRAVGAANGQNPIAIIVPCHRVIGSSGDLVGYGGGLWRKKWLLAHEGHAMQRPLF